MNRKIQKLEYASLETRSLPPWARWLIVVALSLVLILSVLVLIHYSRPR